jgi:7-cyano-7-deazaguanine reductase
MEILKGNLSLGKNISCDGASCDASLLCVIGRNQGRAELKIDANHLPFSGVDLWTAYELSWLNQQGKPLVALGTFFFPCSSAGIVESKSFKLYLASFHQARFERMDELKDIWVRDLSRAVQAPVEVCLYLNESCASTETGRVPEGDGKRGWPGICLDSMPIEVNHYHVCPDLLKIDKNHQVKEAVYTHLFRSNCPVTGQPDWASVLIQYEGNKLEHEGLLKYLCSYRQHQGFHEQCIERIYMDLLNVGDFTELSIEARFLRRGGLDINPFRSKRENKPLAVRQFRQ